MFKGVSISYGAKWSFRRPLFYIHNTTASALFQSPTEPSGHSDKTTFARSSRSKSFNLLRSQVVIPTGHAAAGRFVGGCFNLLRSQVVIPTLPRARFRVCVIMFQSPTEPSGHSDAQETSRTSWTARFQSPTEPSGHSDVQLRQSEVRQQIKFQSPTEPSGHSDVVIGQHVTLSIFVSISYGAKWSFRQRVAFFL